MCTIAKSIIIEVAFRTNRPCGGRSNGSIDLLDAVEAQQAERLKRNSTEFRLEHKPSKRNLERSEHNLLDADKRYKLNSTDDFFYRENYLKINNTSLSAAVTAKMIVDTFGFCIEAV